MVSIIDWSMAAEWSGGEKPYADPSAAAGVWEQIYWFVVVVTVVVVVVVVEVVGFGVVVVVVVVDFLVVTIVVVTGAVPQTTASFPLELLAEVSLFLR
jgi:hypothetical protein